MTHIVMTIKKKQTAPDRARTIPQRVGRELGVLLMSIISSIWHPVKPT